MIKDGVINRDEKIAEEIEPTLDRGNQRLVRGLPAGDSSRTKAGRDIILDRINSLRAELPGT